MNNAFNRLNSITLILNFYFTRFFGKQTYTFFGSRRGKMKLFPPSCDILGHVKCNLIYCLSTSLTRIDTHIKCDNLPLSSRLPLYPRQLLFAYTTGIGQSLIHNVMVRIELTLVSQWTQNYLRMSKIHHGVSDHLKVSSERNIFLKISVCAK